VQYAMDWQRFAAINSYPLRFSKIFQSAHLFHMKHFEFKTMKKIKKLKGARNRLNLA